jgi:hydrogenase maturation factor
MRRPWLRMGKLSAKDLEKLLHCIKENPAVTVPPLPGYDSGVHKLSDGRYLVISTDPCINVPQEWFGWLMVNYASSDVALFGARPEFCAVDLLGPMCTPPHTFFKIMKQACRAADELRMAIVTGHTGTYEGLATLVGVCTAYGVIGKEQLITPGGAKPGDYILCTKPLGLEIAVNLALLNRKLAETLFGGARAKELPKLVKLQSCAKEALTLSKVKGVHAMHDATEGGLITALNELAQASRVGFKIEFEKIPIAAEAMALKRHFHLSDQQVLSMSSTGTILAAVDPEYRNEVVKTLRHKGIRASVLGVFTGEKDSILVHKGRKVASPKEAVDPYASILSGKL